MGAYDDLLNDTPKQVRPIDDVISDKARERGIEPSSVGIFGKDEIKNIVTSAAEKYGVSPEKLLALGQVESSLNPSAQNTGSSAGGLFQFINDTWKRYGNGQNKFDPVANADAAARMLRSNLDRFGGDYDAALAAHHVGPGKARQALSDSSIGDKDISTQGWLSKINKLSGDTVSSKKTPEQEFSDAFNTDAYAPKTDYSSIRDYSAPTSTSNEQQSYEKQLADQAEREKAGLWGSAKEGAKRGLIQSEGLLGGMGALLGKTGEEAIGQSAFTDWLQNEGMSLYKKKMGPGGESENLSHSASLSDVFDGKVPVTNWMADSAGYLAYQAAESIMTGGFGAIIAKTAGKDVVAATLKPLVAKEVERLSAAAAAKVASGEIAAGAITKEMIAKQAVSNTAQMAGAGAVVFANNLRQEAGGIYPEALESQAKDPSRTADLGRIWASSLGAALVDTGAEVFMGKQLLGLGNGYKGGYAKRLGKEAGANALVQGSTEGVQTVAERFGAKQDLTGEEATRDYVDSIGVGALGGTLGAPVSARRAFTPEQDPALTPPVAQSNSPLTNAVNTAIHEDAKQGAAIQDQTQQSVALIAARDQVSQKIAAIQDVISRRGETPEAVAALNALLQKQAEINTQLSALRSNPRNDMTASDNVARIRQLLDTGKYEDSIIAEKLIKEAKAASLNQQSQLAEEENQSYEPSDVIQQQHAQQAELQALINEEKHNQAKKIKDTWMDQHIARATQGPAAGFADMVEYEKFLKSELEHLAQTRAEAVVTNDAAKANEAQQKEVELQRIAKDIEVGQQKDTAQKRDAVLKDALANVQPGQNPLRAFDRALKAAGFKDTTFTEQEKEKIARWAAFNSIPQEEFDRYANEPAAPNELIVPERKEPAKQEPKKSFAHIDAAIARKFKFNGKALTNPKTGKTRLLKADELAYYKSKIGIVDTKPEPIEQVQQDAPIAQEPAPQADPVSVPVQSQVAEEPANVEPVQAVPSAAEELVLANQPTEEAPLPSDPVWTQVEKKTKKPLSQWTAEEIQARLDRGGLEPESKAQLEALLAPLVADKKAQEEKTEAHKAALQKARESRALFKIIPDRRHPDETSSVTVKNGIALIDGLPALDEVTGKEIAIPEGAGARDVADILIAAGAITKDSASDVKRKKSLDEIKTKYKAEAAKTADAPKKAEAAPDPVKEAPKTEEKESIDSLSDFERGKAMMGEGIAELMSKLGGKSNLTPEEESAIIPIMSKIFRGAALMGYIKFKESAQFVMKQIRSVAGDEIADKLSIDNIQAGYINIAKEIGGDKKEALAFDSIDELMAEDDLDTADSVSRLIKDAEGRPVGDVSNARRKEISDLNRKSIEHAIASGVSEEDVFVAINSPGLAYKNIDEVMAEGVAPVESIEPAKVQDQAKEPWQMTREEAGSSLNAKGWRSSQGVLVVAPSPESGLYEHDWIFGKKHDVYLKEDEAEKFIKDFNSTAHRRHVEYALSKGKPVPASVLADYPDIKPAPGNESFAVNAENEQKSNERESIADYYAAALLQETSDYHREFADNIIAKNGWRLKFLSNGLNSKGKEVFTKITGVKLPTQNGATWKAIREWAGISDHEDALQNARYAYKVALDGLKRESANPDVVEKWVNDNIAAGYTNLVNRDRKWFLANAEGRAFDLSKKGTGLGKARDFIAAAIEFHKVQQAGETQAEQVADKKPLATFDEGKTALRIIGDPAFLKERLDAIGIKSVSRKDGVNVTDKKRWADARSVIPVAIETRTIDGVPARLADVTIETMENGNVRLVSPAETGNYASSDEAVKYYRESYKDSPEAIEQPAEEVEIPTALEDKPVHIEDGEVELATPAVIEKSLKKSVAMTSGQLKEAQKWLEGEIDKAMLNALDGMSTEYKGDMGKMPFSVFDVPGDGTFKIPQFKGNLERFKDRIKTGVFVVGRTPKEQKVSPADRVSGSGTESTISDFLDDGDYLTALEFAKQINKPIIFGWSNPTKQIQPIAYVEARPFKMPGFEDFNFVSAKANFEKSRAWSIIDLSSGLAVRAGYSSRKDVEAAGVQALRPNTDNPEKTITAEKIHKLISDAFAENKAGTQEQLEAKWVEWAQQQENEKDGKKEARKENAKSELQRDNEALDKDIANGVAKANAQWHYAGTGAGGVLQQKRIIQFEGKPVEAVMWDTAGRYDDGYVMYDGKKVFSARDTNNGAQDQIDKFIESNYLKRAAVDAEKQAEKEAADKAKYAAKVAEIKAKQAERAIVPLSEITVTLKARVEDSNEMAEYDEKADVALKEIDNKMNLARSLIKCLAS